MYRMRHSAAVSSQVSKGQPRVCVISEATNFAFESSSVMPSTLRILARRIKAKSARISLRYSRQNGYSEDSSPKDADYNKGDLRFGTASHERYWDGCSWPLRWRVCALLAGLLAVRFQRHHFFSCEIIQAAFGATAPRVTGAFSPSPSKLPVRSFATRKVQVH